MARKTTILVKLIDKNGRPLTYAITLKTKEEFVRQAREIWGDRYDYTDSLYIGGKMPILIYCPKHDYHFRVAMAQNHILKANGTFQPTGCPICQAEKTHNREYGKDWQKHLRICKKNSRVGKREYQIIKKRPRLTPEERAKRKAEAAARQRKTSTETFFEKLHKMYGNRYDTSLVDYKNREKHITLICPEHGLFTIRPRTLFNGEKGRTPHGCWKCSGLPDPSENHPLTAKEFYRRVGIIYRNKSITFKRKRNVSMQTKITAICAKHGEITYNAEWWLNRKGCEYCNGKFFPADWIKNAKAVHGDKYEYVGEALKTKMSLIHYICPKHGLQEQRYDVHVDQKCGCPYCSNYTRLSLGERKERFLKKAHKKFGNLFTYNMDEYQNNDAPISITCSIHHYTFKTTPDTHIRKNGGCPICAMSSGEYEIFAWLRKHGIENIPQYHICNENTNLDLNCLVVDFYVPSRNLFIEFNGEQHYKEIKYFKRNKDWSLEKQQQRDQTLRDYCQRHGIRLLEIPFDQQGETGELLKEAIGNL